MDIAKRRILKTSCTGVALALRCAPRPSIRVTRVMCLLFVGTGLAVSFGYNIRYHTGIDIKIYLMMIQRGPNVTSLGAHICVGFADVRPTTKSDRRTVSDMVQPPQVRRAKKIQIITVLFQMRVQFCIVLNRMAWNHARIPPPPTVASRYILPE
jgi:hypothetical protein